MATTGTIAQVIGSTFDAQFPETDLPEIYNAVHVAFEISGEKKTLVGEVDCLFVAGGERCCNYCSSRLRIRRCRNRLKRRCKLTNVCFPQRTAPQPPAWLPWSQEGWLLYPRMY